MKRKITICLSLLLCLFCGCAREGIIEDSLTTPDNIVQETEAQTSEISQTESQERKTTTSSFFSTTQTKEIATTYDPAQDYIVFDPITHLFHKTSCKFYNENCIFDWNQEFIEANICEECKPDIEPLHRYETTSAFETTSFVETTSTYYTTLTSTTSVPEKEEIPLSDYEILMLERIVSHEYGADWVSVEEKARIVAAIMNRVYDSRFPDTVRGVLTQEGQFTGFNPDEEAYFSDSIKDSIVYYFSHKNEFDNSNSWWGDGRTNHFYYQ